MLQKLVEADAKLYSPGAAAAYMADPRLCSSLRLSAPDNKNGKQCGGEAATEKQGDKLAVVKEEQLGAVQGAEFVLSEGGGGGGYPATLTYSLADPANHNSVLYSIQYPADPGGPVSPSSPAARLVLSPGDQPAPAPPSSSVQPTCCTFSLSDFGGVGEGGCGGGGAGGGQGSPAPPLSHCLPLPVTEVRLTLQLHHCTAHWSPFCRSPANTTMLPALQPNHNHYRPIAKL